MTMAKEISLYRTARPRWNVYETDGLGRDTYISQNNGGFWKENIRQVIRKPNYPIYHDPNHYTLNLHPAPFKYYSDGSGRDSYILVNDGGLKYDHKSLKKYHLKDFLRTPESCVFNFQSNPLKEGVRVKTHYISRNEMQHETEIRQLERGLISRLYIEENRKRTRNSRNHLKKGYNPYLRVHDREYPSLYTESKYIETVNDDEDLKKTKDKVLSLKKYEFGNTGTNPNKIYSYKPMHTVHTTNSFFPKKGRKKFKQLSLTEAN